ncbi:glycoside hydrolase family 9 protein [Danxiaibacter flavus]|uniref:Endoglucanase n=1 Tax=Danxiaibacter flavus TaxID=3049108 RepID=A0ABV3ZEP1_9BACT|nr:glycoside hydrolase family 9 protein [Chitinophagaceae bacterium DXS]
MYVTAKAQSEINKIRINHVGYYTKGPKAAIIIAPVNSDDFFILSESKKDTVFKGKLENEMQSKNSSLKTRYADFSSFQKNGKYVVAIPGYPNSCSFEIKQHAQHAVAVSSLKGFYYQRVSMPLEEKYAGKWARPAGHPDTAVLIHASAATPKRPEGFVISSPYGWYDAGDYNKYIVNSGITMGTLLSAYEDFTTYFDTLETNIPESNDKVPDILNEVCYNLRWMLTMQDPNDGGVYHKCTNAAFDGMVMPGITKLSRYVVQKGTAATLDFAAVTAQACRIFKKFDKQLPGLSDSCLKASQSAWQWALANPAVAYNQEEINKTFSPKITTGAYGDKHFDDEWFWAASELLATTKDKQYYAVVQQHINTTMTLPSWSNVQMLGYYTLLRRKNNLAAYSNDIAFVSKQLIAFADGYLEPVQANAFKTVMGRSPKDFNWGSNSNAANQSIILINAWLQTRDKKYLTNALSNLDYILGRNATGYSFVTGVGCKSTMHPHHRPSVADNIAAPIPGLLAGGPNPGRQDGSKYEFTEPETAYVDIDPAYASNEIAINWNAPLVYIANAFEALAPQAGW